MNLTKTSLARLQGVHPDLVRAVKRAAADWKDPDTGFIVTQGLRTLAEQKLLKAKGASKTLNSRHLTGHAVDLAATVGGAVRWDWPLYDKLAKAMKAAAKAEKVPITWGGDWVNFKDGPHFELPRNLYK
ncbi:M15 family metallopeptidase [Flavobacterium sp.]|jgi:peptidoglycan L-alanyl-D-glutamate endopeptidase CwlK|uniref:M15 family metallopeptidase n=1 Tax=Flavobacterium sp. TaxID=239 RepID=UPI0037C164F5